MNINAPHKEPLQLKKQTVILLEYIIILLFSLFPIFRHFPFEGNIYLSWEGAYRLYLGQVPYKDFGIPMGFGYWIIPALFFKLFGPYLSTLIKAQAFINILSALAFRSILKSFRIEHPVRFLAVLLYLISYSYTNYWPWYNHTVIVFELIGIAFLLKYIIGNKEKFRLGYLLAASFFLFMSLFTKQDAGAFAFLIGLALIICHGIYEKRLSPIFWFLGSYFLIAICIITPFIPYHIGYWFNYGQPPHYDRLSLYDIINVFLSRSTWIKFYILAIVLILLSKSRQIPQFLSDKNTIVFTILTLGILCEASITQVTSYVPKDTNIFFHSFAVIYIFSLSGIYEKVNFQKPLVTLIVAILIILWWSPYPWNYANAVFIKHFPGAISTETNEVSIRNYVLDTTQTKKGGKWIEGPWKQFKHIYMPKETIDGMKRVLSLDVVKEKKSNIRLLNMSELTPIEDIMGYIPETGSDIPLWYQKNIGMFEEQIYEYENRIKKGYYDVVMYEYVPSSNNFYPFEIEDALNKYYKRIDSFIAPRPNTYGSIEVFIKRPEK